MKKTGILLVKIFLVFCWLVWVSLVPWGIKQAQADEEKRIGVVASIAPFAQWVKGVGGDKVKVTILIPSGADPHTYEPLASRLAEVSKAEVLVRNGAGLETWVDKILKINRNIEVVDISEGIELMTLSPEEQKEHHLFYDPHLWLSIKIAVEGVEKIYRALSEVDPVNERYYLANKTDYQEKLKKLDEETGEKLKGVKNKKFIVYHPSWSYFARDYGLVQIPIEEEEKEPGPRYLVRIIEIARKDKIKVVFVAPQFSSKYAKVIAEEINGVVVSIDPLSERYIENIRITVDKLLAGLK